MVAIRSKTGQPFRRSGQSFAPDIWDLVEEPTPEQLAEPMLLKVEDPTSPDDPRLHPFPVRGWDSDAEGGEEMDEAEGDGKDEGEEPESAPEPTPEPEPAPKKGK